MRPSFIKFLLIFSLKNLGRSPVRTLMISLSVIMANLALTFVVTCFEGFNKELQRSISLSNTGDYQLVDRDFFLQKNFFSVKNLNQRQWSYLLKNKELKFFPQLSFMGFISSTEGHTEVQLIGDDLEYLSSFDQNFENLSASEGVFIGKALAEENHLRRGDSVIFNYQSKNDELMSDLLVIQGVYDWNASDFQRKYIYASRKLVSSFLGIENSNQDKIPFQQILIHHPDGENNFEDINFLKKFPGTLLKTWKEINTEMALVVDFNRSLQVVIFFILAGILMITILTPIIVTWNERISELIALNILGMKILHLRLFAFFEGLVFSILVNGVSLLISLIFVRYLSFKGIDLSHLNEGQVVERAGIVLPVKIYPLMTSSSLLMNFIFPFIVIMSCYLFALRAPVQTIKKARE